MLPGGEWWVHRRVGDEVEIRVRNGDHFFAQPGGQREIGHGEAG
jgi:hypothetical protein